MPIRHEFVSAIPDNPVHAAAGHIMPQAHWNADHVGTERTTITATTTYFVDTAGNDTTGDGSVGSPWLTLQHAVEWVARNVYVSPEDWWAGVQVNISINDGTYNSDTIVLPPMADTGLEYITIKSTSFDAADVTLSGNGAIFAFFYCIGGYWKIQKVTIDASDTSNGNSVHLFYVNHSVISVFSCNLGKAGELGTGNHIMATDGGHVDFHELTISGVAASLVWCKAENSPCSAFHHGGGAITLSVDPGWSAGTLNVGRFGSVYWDAASVSGSSSGPQWALAQNAQLLTTPTVPGNSGSNVESAGSFVGLPTDAAYIANTFGIKGTTTGRINLRANAEAGSWTLTLPDTAGSANYLLSTDGSGNTEWVAPGALTVGATTIASGASGRVLYDNAGVLGEASAFNIVSGQPNVPSGSAYLYDSNPFVLSVDPGGGLDLNWFFGEAGNASVTGDANFCEGPTSGASLTTGYWNMMMGARSGASLTTGSSVVAMGRNAANAATNLYDSVAIGTGALQTATSGGHDILAIGTNALGGGTLVNALQLVAIGSNAANALTGSSLNSVFIGYGVAQAATVSEDNTIIGGISAQNLSTGTNNTIIGARSAQGLTTGGQNTIIGRNINSGNVSYNIIIARGDGLYGFRYDGNLGSTGGFTLTGDDGLKLTCPTYMIRTTVSYNNGAASNTGTLTNAPAAGNPTKWIPVDDNGTTRYIPAW